MQSPIICHPVETAEELAACMEIRNRVFVLEQQLFPDSDRDEHDSAAVHLAASTEGRIIGTVRVYKSGDTWWGGRLAVLKRHRGRAGRELVQAAVCYVRSRGASRFLANIQKENLNFFKNLGWRQISGEFILHDRPHLLVEADLQD